MIATGTRLGPYEIVAPLGAGGMGEVYRARDTKLGRDVALKVISASFTADPERLARFEREAQVLAALNHPHIAQIYGLEDGALVMELVDGGTLADRIARGPVPVSDALAIAKQIADALEAAHEKGIVHRDLKPSNIAFTADGEAKVLDFGLAKLALPDVASASGLSPLSMSPTITSPALVTGAGVLLGTAAYMAPEQVKGREADKRSDVWAFGCVLYEMLTGARPFEAEDLADTLAFVLTKEPDWSKLPANLPGAVTLVLRRCMAKDRPRRTGDIAAVQFVLDEAANIAPVTVTPAPAARHQSPRWRRVGGVAALLVLAVAATALGTWEYDRLKGVTPPLIRFTVTPTNPPMAVQSPGTAGVVLDHALAITPDGKQVIYRAGTRQTTGPMMVRPIDQLDAHPLLQAGVREPVVSPDGRWVAFTEADGVHKVAITGGPSILIASTTRISSSGSVRGLSWGDDNSVVFAMSISGRSTLYTVSAGGGEPKVLLAPDQSRGEGVFWFPSFLPGARAVLFTSWPLAQVPSAGGVNGSTAADNGQIGVFDLRSGQSRILVRGGADAHYVDSGHLVYGAGGSLRAVPFDLARLEVTGDPVPVVDGVAFGAAGQAEFAVSRTGTLVYVPASSVGAAAAPQLSLVWVDRHGREEPIPAPLRYYTYPRLSPDGTKVVLDLRDQDNDLWTWDFARQTLTRLTFDPGIDRAPVLMPDGKRVVFASQRGGISGGGNIFIQATDGTGSAEQLTTSPDSQFPNSISPDGTRIVFRGDSPASKMDLMLLTLDGGKPRITPLIQTMFNEQNGQISPDGHWLAYESDESGQSQIYVRPFPQVEGGRWQVSPAGGTRPLWARNGRELFYLNSMQQLTAVAVQTTPTFSAANPVKISDTAYATPNNGVTYDVSPDGQRFLMIKAKTNDASSAASVVATPSLVFVLNWFDELKQRVAGK